MSRQQLLENRRKLENLHHNNPNYVSRPPIGTSTGYYTVRQSEDADLKWRPSTRNVELRKSQEFVFRPSCKLVEEPWAKESRCTPKAATSRREFQISPQYKLENDRKAFIGRNKRDHKEWHSTVFLHNCYKPLHTEPPTTEVKDLLSYRYARPYRDNLADQIPFYNRKRKQ